MKKCFFPCNLSKYDIMGSFLKNGVACNVRAVLSPSQAIDDTEFHYARQEIKES